MTSDNNKLLKKTLFYAIEIIKFKLTGMYKISKINS